MLSAELNDELEILVSRCLTANLFDSFPADLQEEREKSLHRIESVK